MTHKVGAKGQVVIPKAIRDQIGIEPGDEVVFELDGKADAFCVATALRLDAPLWTGDPEIVALADGLNFEVMDLR
ncbi:MAG TPA: AbrB/MazE/SpoVT family DNA-binding domain-containing protein [Solirubrobacterales bacterium]|nr:AbrB/MazE/SpoVT family DNA-binding domain-containing protein [Solirubrobacterales bacterium]